MLVALVAAIGFQIAQSARPDYPLAAHDPSSLAESAGTDWVFATGNGIRTLRSRDLVHWERGAPALPAPPEWATRAVPEFRGNYLWAPDILHVGNRWFLYYSVSTFGKNTSAIGLATNRTLDPASPDYRWEDAGPVVVSHPGDNFNAIDPSVLADANGRLWMAFGSFWSGIQLVELDPATGLRRAGARITPIASTPSHEIEAATLHHRDGFYYLFVNWGLCCRGVKSTYEIRVGRARKVTGPYIDRDGRPMLNGGGTLVLGAQPPVIGPGHAGLATARGREWFTFHFYDADHDGRATLGLRPLTWDAAGWPVVGAAAK
jgi:arabinan endo-1,5-alpha-L-arabinosidase